LFPRRLAEADQLNYAQQLITEQKAIASALRDMIGHVDAGVDASTLLTSAAFRALLQRLQDAQRAQSELLGAGSCAEVVRRQFATLVSQGKQMMALLGDLSARASPPPAAQPPEAPRPPLLPFHGGGGPDNPFF